MNRHSLFAWLRPVRRPTALGVALWAMVLALSMLSFYVHLWRASAFRSRESGWTAAIWAS